MRLRIPVVVVLGSFAAVAIAACSGGGSITSLPMRVAPSPSAVPSPVVNAQVAVAAVNNAPIAASPLPAPSGYTSTISIPNATVQSGTTITVNSSTTIPANSTIPPLFSSRRASASTRSPKANAASPSPFTTIFFDSIEPSAPITVAGAISVSQAFPAGTLTAGTSYYLGFYDASAPNPAWQTIASTTPAADGQTLTFTGTAASTTLRTNITYGFVIYTGAPGAPSPTPLPAPPLDAYLPQGSKGIIVVNAAGVTATALPITAGSLGLDDAGNVYALQMSQNPTPPPSGLAAPSPVPAVLAEYAAGGTTVLKSFAPSQPANTFFDVSSGAGLVAAQGLPVASDTSPTGEILSTDVWLSSSTGGAPNYTIVEPSAGVPFGIVDHAGNLYLTHVNADGTFNYDVFSPGSSTPTFTIPESIVPAEQQASFNPNYAAVGSDGTLYVTENNFIHVNGVADQLAGLYIYKPAGGGKYTETFVATTADANGPGPMGVDVDANNNIYVANNNQATLFDANYNLLGTQEDSLHDITIYGPGGTSPRHVSSTSFDPVPLAVAADGTLFFSSFENNDGTGVSASFSLLPGATTVTQIASSASELFALYDGTRETTALKRKSASVSTASGSTHAGIGPHIAALARARSATARRAFLQRLGIVH